MKKLEQKVNGNVLLILALAVMVAFSSCQKHLERDEAKSMIAAKKGYPQTHEYDFPREFTKDYKSEGYKAVGIIEDPDWDQKEMAIQNFKNAGLLKFVEEPQQKITQASWPFSGENVETWTEVKVTLSDEGKKYLISEDSKSYTVRLWQTDIIEITGIKEMKELKQAEVSYTTGYVNITPFGDIFNNKSNISNHQINFSLFDDGWKID